MRFSATTTRSSLYVYSKDGVRWSELPGSNWNLSHTGCSPFSSSAFTEGWLVTALSLPIFAAFAASVPGDKTAIQCPL